MGIIDDLKTAVENYETNNVKTEIVSYSLTPKEGTVLNVKETFQFKVKVINESHLDMRNVQVRVNGTEYADVALALAGPFNTTAVSATFNVDAHREGETGYFFGKAKKITNGAKQIVTAQIYKWDASLDHILKDHSGKGPKQGKLIKNIEPD